jgi:hypothetical protein
MGSGKLKLASRSHSPKVWVFARARSVSSYQTWKRQIHRVYGAKASYRKFVHPKNQTEWREELKKEVAQIKNKATQLDLRARST